MAVLSPLVLGDQRSILILHCCVVLAHGFDIVYHMCGFSPDHKYLNVVDGFGDISTKVHLHLIGFFDRVLDLLDHLTRAGEVQLTG